MHNKDKVIFDKKLPYEYNICLYILEELCDKGVIDVFEMTEAFIPRRVFAKQKDSHFNIIETRAMSSFILKMFSSPYSQRNL